MITFGDERGTASEGEETDKQSKKVRQACFICTAPAGGKLAVHPRCSRSVSPLSLEVSKSADGERDTTI